MFCGDKTRGWDPLLFLTDTEVPVKRLEERERRMVGRSDVDSVLTQNSFQFDVAYGFLGFFLNQIHITMCNSKSISHDAFTVYSSTIIT